MREDLLVATSLTLPLNEEGFRWQSQLIPELQKTLSANYLGENVRHLLIYLYVLQPNGSPLNTISQEVVSDVYVFAPIMEYWILRSWYLMSMSSACKNTWMQEDLPCCY